MKKFKSSSYKTGIVNISISVIQIIQRLPPKYNAAAGVDSLAGKIHIKASLKTRVHRCTENRTIPEATTQIPSSGLPPCAAHDQS